MNRPGRFARDLVDAEIPLVMEVKRLDGHGRDLFGGRTVPSIVNSYELAGAPCLSVVTGPWFGGSPALLDEVRAATDRPVLVKDFFTRVSQLTQAHRSGADAVLLTVSLLGSTVLTRLVDACLDIGLTPFVEVTTAEEAHQVRHPGCCVLSVNNKDIRDRERGPADLGRSHRLAQVLRGRGPQATVSASGVATAASAAALLQAGYDGLLVGTSLLGSVAPVDFAREVRRRLTGPAIAAGPGRRPPCGH